MQYAIAGEYYRRAQIDYFNAKQCTQEEEQLGRWHSMFTNFVNTYAVLVGKSKGYSVLSFEECVQDYFMTQLRDVYSGLSSFGFALFGSQLAAYWEAKALGKSPIAFVERHYESMCAFLDTLYRAVSGGYQPLLLSPAMYPVMPEQKFCTWVQQVFDECIYNYWGAETPSSVLSYVRECADRARAVAVHSFQGADISLYDVARGKYGDMDCHLAGAIKRFNPEYADAEDAVVCLLGSVYLCSVLESGLLEQKREIVFPFTNQHTLSKVSSMTRVPVIV